MAIYDILESKLGERDKGKITCAVYLDLSKAFDTVPRDILLKKLHNVGIRGKVFNIIRSIYSNDKAYLKIDGKVAEAFPINQEVRQGYVLSPLLFNIFMADMPPPNPATLYHQSTFWTNLVRCKHRRSHMKTS